jgi:hypothetical protein
MQSIEDVLARYRLPAEPLVPGALTPEFKSILEGASVDRREFDFHTANGDFAKAFAFQAESAPLHKRKSEEDFEKADEVLRAFKNDHDKKSLSEQLAPLVTRACTVLSAEDGELLRKAWAALDLSILSFFLSRAFA